MEATQLACTYYSLAVPLIMFALYLWKRRGSIKHPGRLISSTTLALALVLGLTVWKPVKTPYGPLSPVDVGVMTVAMVFGPAIGGFAGALGSALGALLGGGPVTVVMTARGLEGLVTGYVARNAEGSSGRLLAGVLGGALAIAVVAGFVYLTGDVGRVDQVLSTMLAEASTGIIVGTGASGVIRRGIPWAGDVL